MKKNLGRAQQSLGTEEIDVGVLEWLEFAGQNSEEDRGTEISRDGIPSRLKLNIDQCMHMRKHPKAGEKTIHED